MHILAHFRLCKVGRLLRCLSDQIGVANKEVRAMKRKTPFGVLLISCLVATGTAFTPMAHADSSVDLQSRVGSLAQSIESISDAVLVNDAGRSGRELRSVEASGALADYVRTLEEEAASIKAARGVTVLDTTAEIILDNTAVKSRVVQAQLHVTRKVSELPEGELWEEVIPITLTVAPDGSVAVSNVAASPASYLTAAEQRSRIEAAPEPGAASIDLSGPTNVHAQKINASAAVAYAKKWWNSKNPSYPTSYTKDCTNFASQAMHAGGWTPVPGLHTSDSAWWYNVTINASYTWGGAENLYRFMVQKSKRATPLSYVKDLWLGDILQYKVKGKTAIGHTMVVTNWVNNVPYLTYHSTNTLNKPFSALSGLNVTWFASNVL